jgi:hypothetical protein
MFCQKVEGMEFLFGEKNPEFSISMVAAIRCDEHYAMAGGDGNWR